MKELINKNENETYGVDISKKALTFAKLFCNDNNNKIFFEGINNLNQSEFDFIVATEVLDQIHEDELPGVLKDISEIIKKWSKYCTYIEEENLI